MIQFFVDFWGTTYNRSSAQIYCKQEYTDQIGFLGVEALAIDPNAPNRLYMLVGISYFNGGKTAIHRSGNYGQNFTTIEVTNQYKAHGNSMGRQTGEKLVVDPNNGNILYCGTRSNGLFKSTDQGSTWIRISSLNVTTTPNENGISFVVLDKLSGNAGSATQKIYIGVCRTGDNFYVCSDGGNSWTALSGSPSNLMPQRAVLGSNGMLHITYGNGAGPHGHWSLPEPMGV